MKQTAVGWLHEKLAQSSQEELVGNINLWFKQAKEMEKQQVYSEEEVLNFTQTMLMQYKFGNTNIEQMDLLRETFQLFKNKKDYGIRNKRI